MQYITDTYSMDPSKGGKDAYRITLEEVLYWWEHGLATPISGDDMARPTKDKK